MILGYCKLATLYPPSRSGLGLEYERMSDPGDAVINCDHFSFCPTCYRYGFC